LSFDVNRLQNKINAKFNNQALLEQALTHRSIGQNNNERLEFLGDAILGFIVADAIYTKFPSADEGIMSRLRAHIVNGDALADVAQQLKLSDELVLGQGEMKSGGKHRASILADAVEAIIGALYKDQGLTCASDWVLRVFKVKLEALSLDLATKDPKTQLQEYMQARGVSVPAYSVISTTGLDHDQLFTVECRVANLPEVFTAKASSRKKAEQKVASQILKVLLNDS